MMKYYRINEVNIKEEITYEHALNILLGTWKDNDMSRDMLLRPNRIECAYSTIVVESEDGLVLMCGLSNMMNDEFEYDEEGNRIGKVDA